MPEYIQVLTITTRITAPELDAEGLRNLQQQKEDFWRGIMILNPVLKGDEEPTVIVEITPMKCPIEEQERETASCFNCKHIEERLNNEPCVSCKTYKNWQPKEREV